MLGSMNAERITVSLHPEVKATAQRMAEEAGVPLSAVVAEALQAWTRGRLVDSWLTDYQKEFGELTESELQSVAAETGAVYLPPSARSA